MDEIKKGKRLLIAAIATTLAVSLTATVFSALTTYADGGTSAVSYELGQGAFRFVLECLLLLFIYRGHKWARIVALVLFGLGALLSFIAAIGTNVIMFAMALIYLFVFIVLWCKPVKAYQKYKKTGEIE